jgi:predicted aldo/keto reductase-like oxidoreductase
LKNEQKGIVARHYQLLTGHAIIAPFLKEKLKQIDSGECWWCDKPCPQRNQLKECDSNMPALKRCRKANRVEDP